MAGAKEKLWRWLSAYEVAPVAFAMADSDGLDAFGRARISQPADIFDSQFEYDMQPLYWQDFITGSASMSHVPAKSAVQLQVSAEGDVAIRQTRGYFRYQPGKSQMIDMTYLHEPSADTIFRVGYGDDRDGIFLEHSGTTVNVLLRSSTSGVVQETRIAQASWNADRMQSSDDAEINDRFNPSGHVLDHSKAQHLLIDFQWLGVGRARVGFYLDGIIQIVHKFQGDNIGDGPYMRSGNLPLRYELRGLAGIAAPRTALQICLSVHSEGGVTLERGKPFAATLGTTGTSVSTRRPVLSIRPAATFKGITNRTTIEQLEIILQTEDDAIFWEVLHGPVISGSSWQTIDAESAVEQDRAATSVVGGTRVKSGYLALPGAGAASGDLEVASFSKLPLALDIEGNHPSGTPSDILSLVVTSLGVGSTTVRAGIHGLELR